MRKHVADYDDLTKRARLKMDLSAATFMREQQDKRDEALDSRQTSLNLLRDLREAELRDVWIVNSLDDCRFDDVQKQGLFNSFNAIHESVDSLRNGRYAAPSVPTPNQQLAFIDCVRDINFKSFTVP